MPIQCGSPYFLGGCLTFLHVPTAHNDPTTYWCDKSQRGTGFENDASFWCNNFRGHHSLRTSLCQFQSSLFPDARVGSCYDNSLPVNGGFTGTPTSSQMVPGKNSGWFAFLIRTRSCVFLWLLCKPYSRSLNRCYFYAILQPSCTQSPATILFRNLISAISGKDISSVLPAEDLPLWLILCKASTACTSTACTYWNGVVLT